MFLMKFGKKEHLEQLKKGIVHFSPLANFISDSTKYRGDFLEGKLLIDHSKPFLINGHDISPYLERVTQSFVGMENILSFSASMLNFKNCCSVEDDEYTLKPEAINEMQQFGEWVFLFDAEAFIQNLKHTLRLNRCNCEYHPISYCDKNEHSEITALLRIKERAVNNHYNYCFIKDKTEYENQNEWRFIIDDLHHEFPVDSHGGVNIQTEFSSEVPLFKTSDLHTLRVSEVFLK